MRITARPALQALMAVEFHKPGKRAFFDAEPKLYLARLTPEQKAILADDTADRHDPKFPRKSFMSFMIFGDGYINRPIGGTVVHRMSYPHVLRPNASLSIFYKDDKGAVELAFYTRYVVINYGTRSDSRIRKRFRDLDSTHQRSLTTRAIQRYNRRTFEILSLGHFITRQVRTPKGLARAFSLPGNARPHEFAISMEGFSHAFGFASGISDPYNSYMSLVYNTNSNTTRPEHWRIPRWMMPARVENTMHGMFATKECWMIGRNFNWMWPQENEVRPGVTVRNRRTGALLEGELRPEKWSHYLAKAYSDFRKANAYPGLDATLMSIPFSPQVPKHPRYSDVVSRRLWFLYMSRNPQILEIFKDLVGLPYDLRYSMFRSPPDSEFKEEQFDTQKVSAVLGLTKIAGSGSRMKGVPKNFWKGERMQFVKGELRGKSYLIEESDPTNRTLRTKRPMRAPGKKVKPGDLFVLDNCYKKKRPLRSGMNVYGHAVPVDLVVGGKRKKIRPWTRLRLYRRSDRFTSDEGDGSTFR